MRHDEFSAAVSGLQWCMLHREAWREADPCSGCEAQRQDSADRRAMLTRALTAQAWMVAIIFERTCQEAVTSTAFIAGAGFIGADLAALPSPAELAAEILGDR